MSKTKEEKAREYTPKNIFLNVGTDGNGGYENLAWSEVTWCRDKVFKTDVPYIQQSEYDELKDQLRWRKVEEELPEDNEDVLVKINIQGYIHFAIDRVIYGEWMNGDDGIIEWKPID